LLVTSSLLSSYTLLSSKLSSPNKFALSPLSPLPPAMAHLFTQPLDIEPLPIQGMVLVSTTNAPPPHPITLDRQTSHYDFNDIDKGRCDFAALNRLKSLVERSFCTSHNPETPVSRSTWLIIVTELLVTLHKSICTVFPMVTTLYPTPLTTWTEMSWPSFVSSQRHATPSIISSETTRMVARMTPGRPASVASNSAASLSMNPAMSPS
jgi:hypothetical protein